MATPYCTVDEIRAEFKDIRIESDTPITETEVENFILEESAFIDANISSKYKTPIDTLNMPVSALVLKKICRTRTAMRIKMILMVKTGDEGLDQQIRGFQKEAADWLKKIKDGTIQLPDASLSDTDSLRSFNADQGVENFFDVTKQQW
jgi:phage gp36-like protein